MKICKVAENGDLESILSLLEENVDIDETDEYENTALMNAAYFSHFETIELLLQHNPDINLRNVIGNSALMLALSRDFQRRSIPVNDFKTVKLLLKHGADVNCKNNYGETVLRDDILRNLPEIVLLFQKYTQLFEESGQRILRNQIYRCSLNKLIPKG